MYVALHHCSGFFYITLCKFVPQDVDAAMVEEVRVNWVEAHHLLQQGQQQQQQQQHSASLPEFEGKQELVGSTQKEYDVTKPSRSLKGRSCWCWC